MGLAVATVVSAPFGPTGLAATGRRSCLHSTLHSDLRALTSISWAIEATMRVADVSARIDSC